jgi:DNA-binding NarL/FixJ family response regulator
VTHVLRVVIADDDPVMRMLLSAVIGSDAELELVGQAEDADGAIALVAAEAPDVALLDVEMPGGGGLRAAREIKVAAPNVRVLALSAHDTDDARAAMSEAGADGYVVKGAPPAELAAALRGGASLF